MTVRDIMSTPALWCRRETDLGTAARMMLEGHVGTLPVLDDLGRVVGVITDRDVAMALALRQRNAAHVAVHEAMTEPARTCAADADVQAALSRMAEARVRRLPVVDSRQHLQGLLSIDDVTLRAVGAPGGISAVEFVTALQRIYAQPPVEPAIDLEVFVAG